MKNTRKIIYISLLVAICVVLSVVDKLVCNLAFPFLPTAKIGLANIIILYALYKYNFVDVLIMVILKAFIAGLILSSPMTFIISFCASITSFIMMWCLKRFLKEKISIIGVSLAGGFTHICMQLLVTTLIYKLNDVVLYYGGFLILVSLITSILIGLIDKKLVSVLNNNKHS